MDIPLKPLPPGVPASTPTLFAMPTTRSLTGRYPQLHHFFVADLELQASELFPGGTTVPAVKPRLPPTAQQLTHALVLTTQHTRPTQGCHDARGQVILHRVAHALGRQCNADVVLGEARGQLRVPRGMPRHLPGPSVAGSGSSTQSRPANLLQWRMVALLNMLAKLPGKDECCWCTTQC